MRALLLALLLLATPAAAHEWWLANGGGSGTASVSTLIDDVTCAGGEVVSRNVGDTAFECSAAGAGDITTVGDCLTGDCFEGVGAENALSSIDDLDIFLDVGGSGATDNSFGVYNDAGTFRMFEVSEEIVTTGLPGVLLRSAAADDPADDGLLNLPNNQKLCWELNPAGAGDACIYLTSTNLLNFNMWVDMHPLRDGLPVTVANTGFIRMGNTGVSATSRICWRSDPSATNVCIEVDSNEMVNISGGQLDSADTTDGALLRTCAAAPIIEDGAGGTECGDPYTTDLASGLWTNALDLNHITDSATPGLPLVSGGGYGGASTDPNYSFRAARSQLNYVEDWCFGEANLQAAPYMGDLGWTHYGYDSGSAISSTAELNLPCVKRARLIITSTSKVKIGHALEGCTAAGCISLSGNDYFAASHAVTILSDEAAGTEEFNIYIGWCDDPLNTNTTIACTDGIYFKYDEDFTTGTDGWLACVSGSGSETCTATGVVPTLMSTAFQLLEIRTDATAANVYFYIDGTLEHTETGANIPTATEHTAMYWGAEKEEGTGSRESATDFLQYVKTYPSGR